MQVKQTHQEQESSADSSRTGIIMQLRIFEHFQLTLGGIQWLVFTEICIKVNPLRRFR
jgi:hypothetical protein